MKTAGIRVTVNGQVCEKTAARNQTPPRFLREELFLTSVKEGCGEGECGACTALVDSAPVNSCLALAAEMEAVLDEMDRNRELGVFVHLDMDFHGLVMDAAGSPALKRAWKLLRMADWTYLRAAITAFSLDEPIARHRDIFRHIKAREEDA